MSHTRRRHKTHNAHDRGKRRCERIAIDRAERYRRMVAARSERDACDAILTDCAIVQWLERIVGIDIRRRAYAHLLGQGRRQLVEQMDSGKIRIAGTRIVLRVRDGRVIEGESEGGGHG